MTKLLHRQPYHRALVALRAQIVALENAALADPVARLLEDVLRIGLEHDALAGSPAARVHAGVIALGKLVPVEVRVELRPQVDVALRALERAEELAHVLRI